MSSGGNSSSQASVSYQYYMGVQLAICHGPVDSLRRIVIGERVAWEGDVTDNATININKPELFGGESREGGVSGDVEVLMGDMSQGRSDYLARFQGADCSAYRGLMNLVFKSFMWASGNPYFKAPWIEVTRIKKGWFDDQPWNPEDAVIGTLDMNPAHIIYQCFIDPAWGMGYNASDMGDESFRAAAAQLKSEGFGLSIEWTDEKSIEDFIKIVLNHINGAVGLNMSTGKLELKLIRDDYDIDELLEVNESNILEVRSFQRALFGEAVNEVTVIYTDRDGNDKPIVVQNLASITVERGVISTTQNYPGIHDPELAARVALRDLATLASPLAHAVIVTNRVLWGKSVGDVIKLNWPSRNIAGVPFRITDIKFGKMTDSKIEVSLIEDVFGLPVSAYTVGQTSQWIDTVVAPVAVNSSVAIEAPYWEVIKHMSIANRTHLSPTYGFGMFMASRGAIRTTFGYKLSASADDVEYVDVANGGFSPTGLLASTIDRVQTVFYINGGYDLNTVELSVDGGYLVVNDEFMSVVSCDASTGRIEVGRGVLDTLPSTHSIASRVFFKTVNAAYDPTERIAGETVHYRPRPTTGLGALVLDDAETDTLVLADRASRPYPPGNFKIDGERYPVNIAGPGITVTWSHRDREAQTVDFVDHTIGNIGPEPGTTYRLRVYSGSTLLRTYDLDAATTSWSYPTAHDVADGRLTALRVTLNSVRDGLESLYGNTHTFSRAAVSGGLAVEAPPVAPILQATPGNFSNNLTWDFGDSRTNLKYTEMQVADVPDFTKSTPLKVVNYPTQEYLHEIELVSVYRWYWARVADVTGQLSPWSNLASARPTPGETPTQMLDSINALLTDGSGTKKIQVLADRFSIVAPDGTKTPFAVVDTGGGVYKTLLNSDVLIGGNVDISNLTSGSLPSDVVMRLGGGVVELDGSGEIRVFKNTTPNADFVRLSSAEIRFLRYINGAYQSYNFLSRNESGIANSGATVTIPGYWKAQPKVMVSPAILSLYKAAYAAQDQNISCNALNLQETTPGSGVWQFDATAMLTLAANTGGGALSVTSGATASNTYTTTTQTTPANCVQITPSVTVQSQHGNGLSQNYHRSVKWRVEYYQAGSWVQTAAWRTVNIGDTVNAITDSIIFNFPSAGAWQWRIAYVASDTDGSVFGTQQYTYNQATVSGGIAVTSTDNYGGHREINTFVNFPANPISGEVYQVDYSFQISVSNNSGTSNAWTRYAGRLDKLNGAFSFYNADLLTYPSRTVYTNSPPTLWSLSSYATAFPFRFSTSDDSMFRVEVGISDQNITATIFTRTSIVSSTATSNVFSLSSYSYNLTSAQVLATGSLNWMAVGE